MIVGLLRSHVLRRCAMGAGPAWPYMNLAFSALDLRQSVVRQGRDQSSAAPNPRRRILE